MQRPSFQFYPGDWQSNKNLRRCTHHEKGVWLDVMCLMHDSEEYGVLRWPLEDIAQAVSCQVEDLLQLKNKHVLKGADPGEVCEPFIYVPRSGRQDGEPVTLIDEQAGPIWYSSRFVRDEYKRGNSGGDTKFKPGQKPPSRAQPSPSQRHGEGDGDGQGDGPGDGRGDGRGDGASSSSSSSTSSPNTETERQSIVGSGEPTTQTGKPPRDKPPKGEDYTEDFLAFWEIYPRRIDKKGAFKGWCARLKQGADAADLMTACKHYQQHTQGKEERFILHPSTFLGPNDRWKDYLSPESAKPEEAAPRQPGRQPGKQSNVFLQREKKGDEYYDHIFKRFED